MQVTTDYLETYGKGCALLGNEIAKRSRTIDMDHPLWNPLQRGMQMQAESVADFHAEASLVLDDGQLVAHEIDALAAKFAREWQMVDGVSRVAKHLRDDLGDDVLSPGGIAVLNLLEYQGLLATSVVELAKHYKTFMGQAPPVIDKEFPSLSDVPAGQNPIAYFVNEARQKLKGSPIPDTVEVLLPAGAYKGVSFQDNSNRTELIRVPVGWMGESQLVLRAPIGLTTILPVKDPSGASFSVNDVSGWAGRLLRSGFIVQGSGKNGLRAGRYAPQSAKDTVWNLEIEDCEFVDSPKNRTLQPVSVNLTGLTFRRCLWDMPRSYEHGSYQRNGLFTRFEDCRIEAVGGQFVQVVNRSDEYGAECYTEWPKSMSWIKRCVFKTPHTDESRAGSGITLAGDGNPWALEDSVFIDDGTGKHHNVPNGDSYGGMASWDGGKKGPTIPGTDRYQGDVTIERCAFYWKNGNRDVMNLQSATSVTMKDVSVYTGPTTTKAVRVHAKAEPFTWNGEWDAAIDRLAEEGVNVSQLKKAQVKK